MTETESKLLTGLSDKMDALHRRFDGHEKEHAVAAYKLEQISQSQHEHKKALYGNGKAGLLTDMAKLKSVLNWLLGIASGVIVAALIAHFVRRCLCRINTAS
jgi:hypothetical protein